MSSSLFIGIDPGQNGGLAMIHPETGRYTAVAMPDTRLQIITLLRMWHETFGATGTTATVESVHSMPKQGVASTFKFGQGYGEVLGICTALGFKILEPTPQRWKKDIMPGMDRSDKNSSIQQAENLFPRVELVQPRCRKPHDGAAEALLLAEWGRRQV